MIKFNLERALAGDKVVTRDGHRACKVTRSENHKHLLMVDPDGGIGRFTVYKKTGRYTTTEHALDLFMAEEAWAPEPGDLVEVRLCLTSQWLRRSFAYTYAGQHYCAYDTEHVGNPKLKVHRWDHMRKAEPTQRVTLTIDGRKEIDREMTLKEIDEKFIL